MWIFQVIFYVRFSIEFFKWILQVNFSSEFHVNFQMNIECEFFSWVFQGNFEYEFFKWILKEIFTGIFQRNFSIEFFKGIFQGNFQLIFKKWVFQAILINNIIYLHLTQKWGSHGSKNREEQDLSILEKKIKNKFN